MRVARPSIFHGLPHACWGSGDTVTTWDVRSERAAPSVPCTGDQTAPPSLGPPAPCARVGSPMCRGGAHLSSRARTLVHRHGLCPAPPMHVHRPAWLPERQNDRPLPSQNMIRSRILKLIRVHHLYLYFVRCDNGHSHKWSGAGAAQFFLRKKNARLESSSGTHNRGVLPYLRLTKKTSLIPFLKEK